MCPLDFPARNVATAGRRFDVGRDTSKSIGFGAGRHICDGAFASRGHGPDLALPAIFSRRLSSFPK
jgi:cytochrome P450